jgi:hypothetical protein
VGLSRCSGSGSNASVTRSTATGVGRSAPYRNVGSACSAGQTCRAGACGTDRSGGANMGSTAATTCRHAPSRAAAGGSQLGRHRRTTCSELGRSATRGCATSSTRTHPPSTRTSPRRASAPASTSTSRACSRADLGIASSRVACSLVRRRWMGAAGTVVGRRPAGRRFARPGRHRLGDTPGQRAARVAPRALVERAGRPIFVGRAQDRRTRCARRAVVVGACCVAKLLITVVGPGSV